MRDVWKSFSFWVSDTFRSRGRSVSAPDDLTRTIRDASHTQGGHGGPGVSASTEALRQITEGSEEYQKSFERTTDD